jgi:hypothetical protein
LNKWLKVGAVVVVAVVLTIILAQHAYVRYSDAHLVVDGRVMTDFTLYFGPNGRLLLRIGEKTPRQLFVYDGNAPVLACPVSDAGFRRSTAFMRSRRGCTATSSAVIADENSLSFHSRDGHAYEVSWQTPTR